MLSGLCLDMSDRAAFLYTAFDSMFSSKFCGSRAADFCGSVSNGICMLISAKDVTETLNGYDQIFRRVLKKLQAGSTPIQKIAFLVNFEAGSVNGADEISKEISDRLSQIWGDFASDGQVTKCILLLTKISNRLIGIQIQIVNLDNSCTIDLTGSILKMSMTLSILSTSELV